VIFARAMILNGALSAAAMHRKFNNPIKTSSPLMLSDLQANNDFFPLCCRKLSKNGRDKKDIIFPRHSTHPPSTVCELNTAHR
jgi:hypothetical protein